ncbi:MAG: hypothetical protein AAF531_14695 [Actinomycetota bacterium]
MNTRRRLFAAAVALVLLLTGCTDDGTENADEPATGLTADGSDSADGDDTDNTDDIDNTDGDGDGDGDDQGDPDADGQEGDDEDPTSTTTSDAASLGDSAEQADTDSTDGSTNEDPDETVAPPPSLVPEDFCEPTRVDGQAIRFQAGAEQAVLRSPAEPGQSDLYSVQVADSQILNVAITSDNDDVVGTLLPPDGFFIPGVFTDTAVTDTQAGNYWICVISGDVSDRYELVVSVINNNSPTKVIAPWCGDNVNDRGEIRFAAGASSGQVDDAVILGERDRYTLDAGAGQRFRGELSAAEANAAFQLRAPSGIVILDIETTTNTEGFSIELPESGVYELCVGGTRGNATYTIDIIIE